MTRRIVVLSCVALTAALALAWPSPQRPRACGPFMPEAIFTRERLPDFPLERFAAGELGVLEPSYARSYLAVAWRTIEGPPLTTAEQRTAVLLWHQRLREGGTLADVPAALREWAAARARVPGAPRADDIEVYVAETGKDEIGGSILNCPDDAFRAAVRSLDERVARFGAHDPRVLAWVKAQDTVFAACGTTAPGEPAGSPDPPQGTSPASGDPYQRASAAFYAGNHALAEQLFRRIALDAASPWRAIAPYLAARCIVRHATLSAGPGQSDMGELARADALLDTLLTQPRHAPLRRWCLDLRDYVRFRLDPARQLADLSASVRSGRADSLFGHDLADYTHLVNLAADPDRWHEEQDSAHVNVVRDAIDRDELADWLLTFQQCDAGPWGNGELDHPWEHDWAFRRHGGWPYAHALERWRTTHRTCWLIACLAATPAGEPAARELVAAAMAVPSASPAWPTLACLRARRALAEGRDSEARALADSALARPQLPRSALNRFEDVRAAAATGYADFTRHLARRPSVVTYAPDGYGNAWEDMLPDDPYVRALVHLADGAPRCFDESTARTFNHALPVSVWLAAASDSGVPARLRGELALAGWTRALLTGRDTLANAFVPALAAAQPELAPSLADWRDARGLAREFAAAFVLLRTPGARPAVVPGVGRLDAPGVLDSYRDNWWSGGTGAERGRHTIYGDEQPWDEHEALPEPPAPPAWLDATERAALAHERAVLDTVAAAPRWLGRTALAWARAHPDDPRVPEALHRVVRAVRLGDSDSLSAEYAHAAFVLLHRRYPASAWTQKTKVWGT